MHPKAPGLPDPVGHVPDSVWVWEVGGLADIWVEGFFQQVLLLLFLIFSLDISEVPWRGGPTGGISGHLCPGRRVGGAVPMGMHADVQGEDNSELGHSRSLWSGVWESLMKGGKLGSSAGGVQLTIPSNQCQNPEHPSSPSTVQSCPCRVTMETGSGLQN